jgi:hypothetical protein
MRNWLWSWLPRRLASHLLAEAEHRGWLWCHCGGLLTEAEAEHWSWLWCHCGGLLTEA